MNFILLINSVISGSSYFKCMKPTECDCEPVICFKENSIVDYLFYRNSFFTLTAPFFSDNPCDILSSLKTILKLEFEDVINDPNKMEKYKNKMLKRRKVKNILETIRNSIINLTKALKFELLNSKLITSILEPLTDNKYVSKFLSSHFLYLRFLEGKISLDEMMFDVKIRNEIIFDLLNDERAFKEISCFISSNKSYTDELMKIVKESKYVQQEIAKLISSTDLYFIEISKVIKRLQNISK